MTGMIRKMFLFFITVVTVFADDQQPPTRHAGHDFKMGTEKVPTPVKSVDHGRRRSTRGESVLEALRTGAAGLRLEMEKLFREGRTREIVSVKVDRPEHNPAFEVDAAEAGRAMEAAQEAVYVQQLEEDKKIPPTASTAKAPETQPPVKMTRLADGTWAEAPKFPLDYEPTDNGQAPAGARADAEAARHDLEELSKKIGQEALPKGTPPKDSKPAPEPPSPSKGAEAKETLTSAPKEPELEVTPTTATSLSPPKEPARRAKSVTTPAPPAAASETGAAAGEASENLEAVLKEARMATESAHAMEREAERVRHDAEKAQVDARMLMMQADKERTLQEKAIESMASASAEHLGQQQEHFVEEVMAKAEKAVEERLSKERLEESERLLGEAEKKLAAAERVRLVTRSEREAAQSATKKAEQAGAPTLSQRSLSWMLIIAGGFAIVILVRSSTLREKKW